MMKTMGKGLEHAEPGQLYAAAQAAHHARRELATAIELYERLIASFPNTPEASQAKAKIQEIVDGVKNEMQDALLELRIARYELDESLDEG
jgi:hypothetical protein